MLETDVSSLVREDIVFHQLKEGFRYGTDSFLLADFVKLREKEKVIELGIGCGVVSILLLKKYEGVEVTGIDIVKENVELSMKNARINGVADRFSAEKSDVREIKKSFSAESFDVVVANPPFIEADSGTVNPSLIKAAAKHEILAKLEDFIMAASYVLRNYGRFYMVCNIKRLVDTIHLCRNYRLEPKNLRFVHPKKTSPATIFLLNAVKNAGKGVDVAYPLVLYQDDETYTEELKKRYENFFSNK